MGTRVGRVAGRRRWAILVAVVAVTALGGPSPSAAAGDGLVSFPERADREATERYWTAQRIARARPVAPLARAASPGVMPAARDYGPVPFTSAAVIDPASSAHSIFGKLFVTYRGRKGPFECSATVVDSVNRSTIFTAAHCLYTRSTGPAKRVLFVPSYGFGQRPYGRFAMKRFFVLRNWFRTGREEYDFGAVVMQPAKGGLLLADAVGAVPLVANFDPAPQAFAAFGYPANRESGQVMWRCDSGFAGTDPAAPRGVPPAIAMGCDMRKGASGGGWIVAGGLGSVTSYYYPKRKGIMFGPTFGADALKMRDKAGTVNPVPRGPDPKRFSACVAESRGCQHRFFVGSLPVLRFADKRKSNTAYRVCVKDPVGTDCITGRTGRRGKPDFFIYEYGSTGRHVARWYVSGEKVASWKFRVLPEDA